MAIQFSPEEILETIRMVQMENLDIRTITMGISLRNCADPNLEAAAKKSYEKICRSAARLVTVGEEIEREYGIPIINKRVSVTPVALIAEASASDDYVLFAEYLDRAAAEVGVNFLGGFSALVHKGVTPGDAALIASLPEALARTERVCASVNVATTRAGINMDAVARMGEIIVATAARTAERDGIGCAKLVVFCNAVEDNPFMAGAFHGIGEPDCVVNVGVSGPGVVANAVEAEPNADFGALASIVKRTAFKITRMGELVGRAASEKLGVPFGIVDLSLAPTPAPGDSVARVLEAMGLERIGTHGSTAALALLNDAVKKGGAMASSYVGGLSGAFIPVSEDSAMIEAAAAGTLTFDKLEAMTCVCSVGLDMIAVPGDTPSSTIAAIIADEAAIGMINRKTTAVRLIPAPGKKVGRHRVVRGAARARARHRTAPRIERSVHCSRRANSRAASGTQQLKERRAQPTGGIAGCAHPGNDQRRTTSSTPSTVELWIELRSGLPTRLTASSTARVRQVRIDRPIGVAAHDARRRCDSAIQRSRAVGLREIEIPQVDGLRGDLRRRGSAHRASSRTNRATEHSRGSKRNELKPS